MLNRAAFMVVVLSTILAGCTSNQIYRSDIKRSPADADTSCDIRTYDGHDATGQLRWTVDISLHDRCRRHSIEKTKEYTLFFIELDEQGRLYDDKQLVALQEYLQDVEKRNSALVANGESGIDLSIVTFVHGWRHNAEYDDQNVKLARQTLLFTYSGEAAKPHPNPSGKPRDVVGIYIGWRGLSTTVGANKREGVLETVLAPWELVSVWDRKNTAQNVAVGSVREVFSLLRAYQQAANAIERRADQRMTRSRNCLDSKFTDTPEREPFHCKRVRLMIVGHSFGGLMAFNAVSGSLIDSVASGMLVRPDDVTCRDEFSAEAGRESALVRSYADLIVLVNPAVEGARFEALHQAVARRARIPKGEPGAFCPNQRPVLVSITSQFDYATRWAFWAARAINTLLESTHPVARGEAVDKYMAREEHTASINTMGHVERFHTHVLKGNRLRAEEQAQRIRAGAPGNAFEHQYLDALKRYCEPGPRPDADNRLLHACRCDPLAWTKVVLAYAQIQQDPEKASCPAYVEELNAADMFVGGANSMMAGLGWMPQDPPPDKSGKDLSNWTYARSPGWVRSYCGGAALQHVPAYAESLQLADPNLHTVHSPSSPVWNVYAQDKGIINGHSDLSRFAFTSMLQQMYHAITVRDGSASSFAKLRDEARRKILEHCTVSP